MSLFVQKNKLAICVVGGVVVVGLILFLVLRKKSGSGSGNGNLGGTRNRNLGKKGGDVPPKKEDNTMYNCLVFDPSETDPAKIKSKCLANRCSHENDTTFTELRCTPCYFQSGNVDEATCAELLNASNDNDESCRQIYTDYYNGKSNCSESNHTPIVPNGNTKNKIQCGQDCSDVDAMSRCYTDYLNSHNLKCEFGSKSNSGNFLENCLNDANSHGLLCNTSVHNACQNVLTNATRCK